eukprot:210604-Chlamydomonas_euryale.AAC.2
MGVEEAALKCRRSRDWGRGGGVGRAGAQSEAECDFGWVAVDARHIVQPDGSGDMYGQSDSEEWPAVAPYHQHQQLQPPPSLHP